MHNNTGTLQIIGAASCWGAQDKRCELGPDAIKQYGIVDKLKKNGVESEWKTILRPGANMHSQVELIEHFCGDLATHTFELTKSTRKFVVIGGDHSCAIGTWSGVSAALGSTEKLGLIWVDAHMDSHIPETSPSGAIHGMPLACLLGHGEKSLRDLRVARQKLLPQNVCLIGIRSFEKEEAALLELLGVKVFYMSDIEREGLRSIWQNALEYIKQKTSYFGLTIDLDAIDPVQAPGVGSPTPHGIDAAELIDTVKGMKKDGAFVGAEITEYNPSRDINNATAHIATGLIQSMFA